MKILFNPRCIFLLNTLPIILFFIIALGNYNIIKSLLSDENKNNWFWFGSVLALITIANAVYASILIKKRKNISLAYGYIALIVYIAYFYVYSSTFNKIIPFNIPGWLLPANFIIYVGTFLMPTLLHALFVLIIYLTNFEKKPKSWLSFLISLCVPISWYIGIVIIDSFRSITKHINEHIFVVIFIASTLVFLFFLIRGFYILAFKQNSFIAKYYLIWKLIFALILPLIGLVINNSIDNGNSVMFGDFRSIWFFVIAILNAVFLSLPNYKQKKYRLALFLARSATLTYTLYFLLVFLPFLPLSIPAIIYFGSGFLILTPLMLFIIHSKEIVQDFSFLNNFFTKVKLSLLMLCAMLILPIFLTISYYNTRANLHKALDYIYTSSYSINYNIDKNKLRKVLQVVEKQKKQNQNNGINEPYLSSYFTWLVLDNLTLSNTKIREIKNIFFGQEIKQKKKKNSRNTRRFRFPNRKNVKITNISSKSTYDKSQNAWLSWVDFEISNNSELGNSEYLTNFILPTGCWISDYYLYVGDKKEMGILAEKKSAMWIYSQIRNQNRDPGILNYMELNKILFRVFPFRKKEIRKTGIEFIHKEPVKIKFDEHEVSLGISEKNKNFVETKPNNNEINLSNDFIYISNEQKKKLQITQRQPYFHLIVDTSYDKLSKEKIISDYTIQIKKFLKNNQNLIKNAKISFANTYLKTIKFDQNWENNIKQQKFSGGFFLQRAIKSILFNSYTKLNKTYPIIIILTKNDKKNKINNYGFSYFKNAFPDNDNFYYLKSNGLLQQNKFLSQTPKKSKLLIKAIIDQKVYALVDKKDNNKTIGYLPNNNLPDIILKNSNLNIDESIIKEKNWNSALALHAKQISEAFHPETAQRNWLSQVRYSFISKIMTPLTSYIVVENEAQKAMLQKKQKQILAANKSLDAGEEIRMSEPSLLICIIILIITFLINYYFRKDKSYNSTF